MLIDRLKMNIRLKIIIFAFILFLISFIISMFDKRKQNFRSKKIINISKFLNFSYTKHVDDINIDISQFCFYCSAICFKTIDDLLRGVYRNLEVVIFDYYCSLENPIFETIFIFKSDRIDLKHTIVEKRKLVKRFISKIIPKEPYYQLSDDYYCIGKNSEMYKDIFMDKKIFKFIKKHDLAIEFLGQYIVIFNKESLIQPEYYEYIVKFGVNLYESVKKLSPKF